MTKAEVFAPAKINLTLHVTGQRADGYHLLDSLVVFASVGDHLTLAPGSAMRLTCAGPFAPGVPLDPRNLAWRAAEACGWTGHIHIAKNLPHGAGIGGGSADAAAVLRALDGPQSGAALGADIPVCRLSRAAHMQGVGDRVAPLTGLPTLQAVLVNPGTRIATPDIFRALRQKTNPAMPPLPAASCETARTFAAWLANQRNDLQTPAITLAPVISDVINAMQNTAPLLVRMSGSGATCFALYPDARTAAAAATALRGAHPDWWVTPAELT